MSKNIRLNGREKRRLAKIDEIMPFEFCERVDHHFNDAVDKAFTLEEARESVDAAEYLQEEVRRASRSTYMSSDIALQLALPDLKCTEIFLRVARRVGTDTEIAACLPARKPGFLFPRKFNKKDVAVLEKCELKSLAAVVRAKL